MTGSTMATDSSPHIPPARGPRAHIPNVLTVGRIVLALPVALLILAAPFDGGVALAALLLFAFAASLDFFDGMLARRWNVVSEFGRALDPVADKILIAAVLLGLAVSERLGGWLLVPAVLIIGRDFAVCGLREFAAGARRTLHVSKLAKWKTAAELAALLLLLAGPAMAPVSAGGELILDMTGAALLWFAAALSVWTGAVYGNAVLRGS